MFFQFHSVTNFIVPTREICHNQSAQKAKPGEFTMQDEISTKFWGVRGSYPTPTRRNLGVGGNTSSLELKTPFVRLLIDAGTGIIPLGQSLDTDDPLPLVLLLSHWHHDHTQGLPFFAPLSRPSTRLSVIAQADDESEVYTRLCRVMGPPQFPVHWSETRADKTIFAADPDVTFHIDHSGTVGFGPRHNAINLRSFRSDAHPDQTTLFRIEYRGVTIVYASDIESDNRHAPEIIRFARGADLLIHDSQYPVAQYLGIEPYQTATRSFGHSTNEMAAAVASAAGVGQLVLFHHDPNSDDDTIAHIEAQTQTLFPATVAAREGNELTFPAMPQDTFHDLRSLDATPIPTL